MLHEAGADVRERSGMALVRARIGRHAEVVQRLQQLLGADAHAQ
jgi:hypothetical protein